ncbi:N-acetyltransferase [Paenisporosarcina cavernae]|uniref:N-acetyltransferase n=2 Tax=Paenisporosarcina cavernae TaxID=2320858 RepID=A0A385YY09_9BACL|nr:N-acetyltransferase [Paenisporosarcina cavernae]
MWRLSKEKAIGQKEIHSVENHLQFLNDVLTKQYQVKVVLDEESVIGMIAYNEEEVSQLYIDPAYQGLGIGQMLLKEAKNNSSGTLSLYTFEVNTLAQQFYEKNGFRIMARGTENEENLPDIRYEWERE